MTSLIDWLFRSRETGRIVIAQFPNPSLGIFLATVVVRRVFDPAGTAGAVVSAISLTALVWWSLDEIIRGVNPWRRILGGTVLTATLIGLLTR